MDDKIKVLCLHGCCQTPAAFKGYLNCLRKTSQKGEYKDKFEFHFLKAPFKHPDYGLTWTDPPLNIENIWRGTFDNFIKVCFMVNVPVDL